MNRHATQATFKGFTVEVYHSEINGEIEYKQPCYL
jgi:hypothetical protein